MSRTLPVEVSEALAKYAIRICGGESAAEELAALESAILAYGDAVREGAQSNLAALRAAVEKLAGELDRGEFCLMCSERLRALLPGGDSKETK